MARRPARPRSIERLVTPVAERIRRSYPRIRRSAPHVPLRWSFERRVPRPVPVPLERHRI